MHVHFWQDYSRANLNPEPCGPGHGSGNDLGTTFRALSQNATDPSNAVAYQLGYQVSQQCVLNGNTALVTNTGWTYQTRSGNYTVAGSTDYLLRARKYPRGSCLIKCEHLYCEFCKRLSCLALQLAQFDRLGQALGCKHCTA